MASIDQVEYWNNEGGARWKAGAERTSEIFEPLREQLLHFSAVQQGERVLDVGCGTGRTTIELAKRVGAHGRVVGLDVSRVLLEVAQEAIAEAKTANVDLVLADAATHDFGADRFDVLFSQFGIMFFAEPVAAFSNLRRALVPSGRVALACWREIEVNPWISLPYEASKRFAPPLEPTPPGAPGPLAFADSKRFERILSDAGFVDVRMKPHDQALLVTTADRLDATANYLANIGLAGRILANVDPKTKTRATTAIREALRERATPTGVYLPSGIWLVSARSA